jgi:hypothetical protein
MLIHFTKSIQSLSSIVRNGFLYLHNETGVLGPAAYDAFGISADDQSNGMVCFTELSPGETGDHQSKFGNFGVGVSKQWLMKHNAQKVMYVPLGSKPYHLLVSTLKSLAPQKLYGEQRDKYLATNQFLGALALTDIIHAGQAGASPEYMKFLEVFAWTQTDKDIAQLEWRVRNPRPYRFKGNPTRKQLIDLLVSCLSDSDVPDEIDGLYLYTIDGSVQLVCTGKYSLALKLPKEEIQALFCPQEFTDAIKSALDDAGMHNVELITTGK